METLYWYHEDVGTLGHGFFALYFTHVGQWGTHRVPPAHFHEGLRMVDEINVTQVLLLVVIDVYEKGAASVKGVYAEKSKIVR